MEKFKDTIKLTLGITFCLMLISAPIYKFIKFFQDDKHEISFNAKKAQPLSQLAEVNHRGPSRAPASGARGLDVTIGAGDIAYLDESTNIDTLTIYGELHCDEVNAPNVVELRVKTIRIMGTFQCGTSANPYDKKLIISLKHSSLDPKVDDGYRGIVVEMGGKLILNGNTQKSGWKKLSSHLNPGDQTLIVATREMMDESPSQLRTVGNNLAIRGGLPWKVGDEIVVGPTGYNYLESEKFIITAIQSSYPYEITLDHAAQYFHNGDLHHYNSEVMGNIALDERAEVANLTRNILIRADEQDAPVDEGTGTLAQRGGHIMVHHEGEAYLNSIELYKMGQAGVMARYPFHWHWVGDSGGQYIKNSSIHHSYQRCVTVHRTDNAIVQNNVCYDFKGHGYFLEDGNERGNQIISNLAMTAKAPDYAKRLLQSDNVNVPPGQGRFSPVSGFWISNPQNVVKNNVASGSVGSGIWMAFDNEVKDLSGNIVATPISEPTIEFSHNSAHATEVGITWDGAPNGGLMGNPNNPNDRDLGMAHYEPPVTPVFIGLKAYKNLLTGIYFRGDTAVFKNTITADNGWSFWVSYNQIVKDSVFIGRSKNTSTGIDQYFYDFNKYRGRMHKTAIVLYDGPFEIHHSDFLDFSDQVENFTISTGQTYDTTVIPFTQTGGTNKFMNYVSGLKFNPEPIYRIYQNDQSPEDRSGLHNGVIRDLDGSLSGTGVNSVVATIGSLGVRPGDHCDSSNPQLHNFQTCPGSYTEGSFAFLRWPGAWGTPFLVRRSDGKMNFAKSDWGYVPSLSNNLFATINSTQLSYEILPWYTFYTDNQNPNVHISLDANSESLNPIAPLMKIVAYGYNCRLEHWSLTQQPYRASSLNELKAMNGTAYFSDGLDFYVKILPTNWWENIVPGPYGVAQAKTSMSPRLDIECDNTPITPFVTGKIESVYHGRSSTTISGYACNFTSYSSINVKLYVYGKPIPSPKYARDTFTLISSMTSNQTSGTDRAFKCGKASSQGRDFKFIIPNSDLARYTNHKIYVKGISNSGGSDMYIDGSGVHPAYIGVDIRR